MTPTKLLIGQILIVFAIVILGVWVATQWAAAMLGYQPELGAPMLLIGETPIYRPWDLFAWWVKWKESVFERGSLASTSRWTAILTVSVKTPRAAEVLRKNPLGLYVEAIDWSREYEAAEPVRPAEASSAVRESATEAVPLPPALPIPTETEGKLP